MRYGYKPDARPCANAPATRHEPGSMTDPFHTAMIEAPACSTTFENPSANAMVGANAEWSKTGCNMTIEVPVGGNATVSSKVVDKALAASIGSAAGENVVIMPTAYRVIGAHCCNPTGASIGLHIDGAETPHVHVGARSGDAEVRRVFFCFFCFVFG